MNVYFILFLAYMVSPKINLFGTSARPEDIISVIAFGIYVFSKKHHPLRVTISVKLYIVYIGFGVISALLNFKDIGLLGIVFAIRPFQYLIWFFIIFESCYTVSWWAFRKSLVSLCTIFIIWSVLQYTGLIGSLGQFGGGGERLSINTSGPFETSVMLGMLAYAVPSLLLTAPMIILILLTQARITLAGIVFSYASAKPIKAAIAGLVAVLLFTVIAGPILATVQTSRIAQSDGPAKMLSVLTSSWERAPILEAPSYFRENFLNGPTIYRYMPDVHGNPNTFHGDLSFRYRAVRWPIVIKTTSNSISHFIVGWSPGSWGSALDSFYVRAFGETGFIGLLLLLVWLGVTITRLRTGGIAKFSLITMIIVGSFIDIFTSSKVMPLFWAFAALEHANHPFAMPQRTRRRKRPTSSYVVSTMTDSTLVRSV